MLLIGKWDLIYDTFWKKFKRNRRTYNSIFINAGDLETIKTCKLSFK